jgi:predicted RNase H-like HicB family nuclease
MTKYEMIIYWSEEDQAYIAEVPKCRSAGIAGLHGGW